MDPAELTLVVANLVAGLGCAVPVAKLLYKVNDERGQTFRYFAVLVGVYLVECVAVVMGMGIPVFSVVLGFVWGVVFGLWLRRRTSDARAALKAACWLALYSSLPAFSFIVLPVVMMFTGWSVLSVEAGASLGIPGYVPWPLNTILGFYAIPAICTVVFKTVITTGEVSVLIHLGQKSAPDNLETT